MRPRASDQHRPAKLAADDDELRRVHDLVNPNDIERRRDRFDARYDQLGRGFVQIAFRGLVQRGQRAAALLFKQFEIGLLGVKPDASSDFDVSGECASINPSGKSGIV